MAFKRGDIVKVFFKLPYIKGNDSHPAIIISNQDVYDIDESYICVMMTSVEKIDMFSFEISQDMLMFPNNKNFSQARCHLVSFVMENHIIDRSPINTLKEESVNRLVARINEVSLSSS